MSNGPGGPEHPGKNTDGGWIRNLMENQAQYNRQVAGVPDPPKGRPLMRNEGGQVNYTQRRFNL